MADVSLMWSKAILAICNFLLLACGFSLITGGVLILFDSDRILLSRLLTSGPLSTMPQPLFHYVAIGLASVGLILASTGILGCWASCMHNYYLLSMYFLVIIVALVGECAVYAIAWAWPKCLGLGIDAADLAKSLQKNYANVGQDQFTAAVDLAQTLFECCGAESANEYDTSLWRLQSLGPSLAIPLSCCKLSNYNSTKAYLDPLPINTTLCQALEVNRHEGYRHLKGCKDHLQQWYHQHYLVFLAIGLVAVLVEFLVLLSTILTCTRIYKYKQEVKGTAKSSTAEPSTIVTSEPKQIMTSEPKRVMTAERTFRRQPPPENAYSNETYVMTNSFRRNYKLVDRV